MKVKLVCCEEGVDLNNDDSQDSPSDDGDNHITFYNKMVVRPESPTWRARTAEVSVTLRDVLESAGQ